MSARWYDRLNGCITCMFRTPDQRSPFQIRQYGNGALDLDGFFRKVGHPPTFPINLKLPIFLQMAVIQIQHFSLEEILLRLWHSHTTSRIAVALSLPTHSIWQNLLVHLVSLILIPPWTTKKPYPIRGVTLTKFIHPNRPKSAWMFM